MVIRLNELVRFDNFQGIEEICSKRPRNAITREISFFPFSFSLTRAPSDTPISPLRSSSFYSLFHSSNRRTDEEEQGRGRKRKRRRRRRKEEASRSHQRPTKSSLSFQTRAIGRGRCSRVYPVASRSSKHANRFQGWGKESGNELEKMKKKKKGNVDREEERE